MLFEPLGMKDTAFWIPKDKVARFADALDSDPLKANMSAPRLAGLLRRVNLEENRSAVAFHAGWTVLDPQRASG